MEVNENNESVEKVSVGSKSENTVYQCSACGAKAEEGGKFCTLCGSKIIAVTEKTVQSSEEKATQPNEETAVLPSEEEDAKTVHNEEKDSDFASEYPAAPQNTPNDPISKAKAFMEKKNISPKILAICIGAAIVVIALLIILIANLGSDSNVICPDSDLDYFYDEESEETILVANGQKLDVKIDGQIESFKTSLDGKTAAFSTEEELYAYYKDSLISVSDEVVSFKLSVEGEAIVYANEDEELILFTLKSKKSKTITDEFSFSSMSSYYYSYLYRVSPDGKSVLYAESTDEEDEYDLHLFTDGKDEKIASNAIPVGVSNKASLIYYVSDKNNSLYVMDKNRDGTKLGADVGGIAFNADHTQAVFSTDAGWYISDNGKDKQKITSKEIDSFGSWEEYANEVYDGYVLTMPINEICNIYFLDASDTLYYIDEKFEAVEVADDVYRFAVARSSNTIYYLDDDGDLYRAKDYDKEFECIASDVERFVITSNGDGCYYLDDEETLRYAKSAKKAEKIASDVERMNITHDDYLLFIISDGDTGTLYSSHNGKEKERISNDVYTFRVTSKAAYYLKTDDEECYDLYGTSKKVKFELLAKELYI